MARTKLLTYTTLYPNAADPIHGIFVEQRLRHLIATGAIESKVVAPVPWFPSKHKQFGRYAKFARAPRREERHGITILHPRYPLIPKVSMACAPYLLSTGVRPALRSLLDDGYEFDLIDAHYFYPDGVAAVISGQYFKKPVIITAHGTDINVIPNFLIPRKLILWAARRAAGIIAVSRALKDRLVDLGVGYDKVTVLPNSVDLELFHPIDRPAWRRRLGLTGTTLLSVGQLIELKGHDIAIRALADLPKVHLLIAGAGEQERVLKRLANSLGLSDRVRFLGAVPQEDLKIYYGVADALVLASSREGLASVLLEAMACGTPVIASDVGGTPEVIAATEAGVLMQERTPQGLVEAFQKLFANYPPRTATRHYAERFGWDQTAKKAAVFLSRLAQR
jgi:glycosyltransferase involved in cell wall biosynthesis